MAEVDLDHGTTLNKKIRNAQLAQFNFILGNEPSSLKLEGEGGGGREGGGGGKGGGVR